MKFVVVSSDGTLYGPFATGDEAATWAVFNEDIVGDWHTQELHDPNV
jgi:hypothetical protein